MNIGGIILSLLLHAGIVLGIIFMPKAPLLPEEPVMMISLTEGSIGGDELPSPILGHLPSAPEQISGQVSIGQPNAKAPEPIKKQTVSKAVPLPQDPKKIVSKPLDKKSIKPISKKKAIEKSSISPDDIMKAALESAQTTAKKDSQEAQRNEEALKAALENESLRAALAEAERDYEDMPAGGGGGSGDGEGGGGLNDIYAAQIVLAVRPHWSMPTYSREVLIAKVRIILEPDGTVREAHLEKASPRPDFNASTVNAVLRTGKLPPPPTPAQQEIVITFNSLELAGS